VNDERIEPESLQDYGIAVRNKRLEYQLKLPCPKHPNAAKELHTVYGTSYWRCKECQNDAVKKDKRRIDEIRNRTKLKRGIFRRHLAQLFEDFHDAFTDEALDPDPLAYADKVLDAIDHVEDIHA